MKALAISFYTAFFITELDQWQIMIMFTYVQLLDVGNAWEIASTDMGKSSNSFDNMIW